MKNWNEKVLFLDFDGVIRVQMKQGHTIDKFEFCPERMGRLASICDYTGLKIVLSTDWRSHSDVYQFIPRLLPHLHEDDKTEVCGQRWEEILKWIETHREVKDFVIMDDLDMHFEDAPKYVKERLILCDSLTGASPAHFDEIFEKLS